MRNARPADGPSYQSVPVVTHNPSVSFPDPLQCGHSRVSHDPSGSCPATSPRPLQPEHSPRGSDCESPCSHFKNSLGSVGALGSRGAFFAAKIRSTASGLYPSSVSDCGRIAPLGDVFLSKSLTSWNPQSQSLVHANAIFWQLRVWLPYSPSAASNARMRAHASRICFASICRASSDSLRSAFTSASSAASACTRARSLSIMSLA